MDSVCSVYVVTNTIEVNYCFMISSKSGFHILGPSMFSRYRQKCTFVLFCVPLAVLYSYDKKCPNAVFIAQKKRPDALNATQKPLRLTGVAGAQPLAGLGAK